MKAKKRLSNMSQTRDQQSNTVNNGDCFAINSPIGYLGLSFNAQQLEKLEFLEKKPVKMVSSLPNYAKKTIAQLEAYFKKPQALSTIEHHIQGTSFQKKVWRHLAQIPVGQTITYGELAKKLHTSARAIGVACRTNPIPLIIPCHRVVSKSDQGGFCGQQSGHFFKIKAWLLQFEKP
jgi:methylated-DNA-[protein]-cysteine S-methyltransferase